MAISLAMWMFLTSTGFSLDIHYCRGEIQHINFLGKAKSCHEEGTGHLCDKMTNSCHVVKKESGHQANGCHMHSDSYSQDEDPCCHNRTIQKESLDQESLVQIVENETGQSPDEIITAFTFHWEPFMPKEPAIEYSLYKPPVLERDLKVLFQVFLN